MAGQAHHFRAFASERIPYAIQRYTDEVNRLYGVLNRRLASADYLAAEYSIADMACWPWVLTYRSQGIDLGAFPNVRRWYDALKERPALRRGYDVGRELRKVVSRGPDGEARRHLFPAAPPGGGPARREGG